MTTTELLNILNDNKDIPLDQLLEKIPDLSLVDYLEMLLETHHTTKAKVILKSTLDRTYGYQIFDGTKHTSQNKIIMLALAFSLDLHDTNILLTLSKNQNLYPKLKRDALIIFAINHHYDVVKTNELLDEYGYEILS
ncbi:MAG: hypothetical protein LUH02_06945 [Erysipelotrichaceae bacterium]|nr:hypothetical protein [Erysipelotrichaceae bacterium]